MKHPFASVDSVMFGSQRLLRALHADEMRRMRETPRDERERHAERASQYRQMMDEFELLRLVGALTR
jgi:hypothetical protein